MPHRISQHKPQNITSKKLTSHFHQTYDTPHQISHEKEKSRLRRSSFAVSPLQLLPISWWKQWQRRRGEVAETSKIITSELCVSLCAHRSYLLTLHACNERCCRRVTLTTMTMMMILLLLMMMMIVRPLRWRWRSINPPGYVGCLVIKNTHRCSYDALGHAGTASQTGPACRKRAVPNRWNVGWMDVGWMCTVLHTVGGWMM